VPAVKTSPAAIGYSTTSTKIGDLLANMGAKAVLDKHFPGMSDDERIAMARGMTLRAVQAFAPTLFTKEALLTTN
jgi:hypothetical protein